MRGEELGEPGRLDENVLVSLVVTTPFAVVLSDERRDLTDEQIPSRNAESRDDRPIVADPPLTRRGPARLPPPQVAKIDREDPSGP